MVQNPLGHGGIEERIGGVDAHAAGVGAGVALADALVVLRGNERRDVLAVTEAEEADLVALEEFLDDDLLLGRTEQRAGEETLRGLGCRGARIADDNAFARREAVSFDHDGRMKDFDGLFDFCRRCADGVVGRGNVVALQEALGESLAGFEHGGGARGAEDAQAALLKLVDDAERKRQLGADDGEVGLLGLGEANHGGEVLEVDGNAAGNLGHAAVAGRADDFRDARAALDRPGQSMFAAAGTKDQDFHFFLPNETQPRPERSSAMGAGEVKRRVGDFGEIAFTYTEAGCACGEACEAIVRGWMVDTRIKPYNEQQAEKAARAEQTRVFRRNQVFGLLIVAAAILAWWLWHTNPKWIFPTGWWRW